MKKGEKNITVGFLIQRQKISSGYWNVFTERHLMIAAHKQADTTDYMTENFFDLVEENFFNTDGYIEDGIQNLKPKDPPPVFNVQAAQAVPGFTVPRWAHLEKINLPNFDGDWLNWPSFKGMFESLVHKDINIPTVI